MRRKGKSNDLDAHIGLRLRDIRKASNRSQESLASAIGITFQQVQKYESGSNRIGGSRLCALAEELGVTVQEFFPEEYTGEKQMDFARILNDSVIADLKELRSGIDDILKKVKR